MTTLLIIAILTYFKRREKENGRKTNKIAC